MQKFGAYMADIMPVVQAEIMKAARKDEPLTFANQSLPINRPAKIRSGNALSLTRW